MKYSKFILIVFLLLCSCQSNDNLKGLWVGEYVFFSEDKYKYPIIKARNLLFFKNNRCYVIQSKYDSKVQVTESNNMWFSNKFTIDSTSENSYEILIINTDSLVVESTTKMSSVYRKVPDSLKHTQNIDLIGKSFIWDNHVFQDTIYFESDSTIARSAYKMNLYKTQSWERIRYEGFDILLIDGEVLYIIEKQKDYIIHLKSFHKAIRNYTLTEI